MSRQLCSCGRAEVELGCDLCAYCRNDYDERAMHREQEAAYNADQQAEYDAWLNERAAAGKEPRQ